MRFFLQDSDLITVKAWVHLVPLCPSNRPGVAQQLTCTSNEFREKLPKITKCKFPWKLSGIIHFIDPKWNSRCCVGKSQVPQMSSFENPGGGCDCPCGWGWGYSDLLALWAAARTAGGMAALRQPQACMSGKASGVKPTFGHLFWGWVLLVLRCLHCFVVCGEESISINLQSSSSHLCWWCFVLSINSLILNKTSN